MRNVDKALLVWKKAKLFLIVTAEDGGAWWAAVFGVAESDTTEATCSSRAWTPLEVSVILYVLILISFSIIQSRNHDV